MMLCAADHLRKICVLLMNEDTFEKHFSFFYRFQRRHNAHNPLGVELYMFVLVLPAGFSLKCHL